MKLTCPACGFFASIELFVSDVDARHFAQLMGQVPHPIADRVLAYIGLFAPEKHKMTFGRGRRLLAELVPLIQAGTITRNRRAWPAPLAAWDQALAQMLERRAQLTLPLRSHGYLLEIVVGLADKAEAQIEAKAIEQLRHGTKPAPVVPPSPPQPAEDLTPQEIAERARRRQELVDALRATPAPPARKREPVDGADAEARRIGKLAVLDEIEQRRQAQLGGEAPAP